MSTENTEVETVEKPSFPFMVGALKSVNKWTSASKIRRSHLKRNNVEDPNTTVLIKSFQMVEDVIKSMIAGPVQDHPAWPWFSRIEGIGPENIAKVLGSLDIHKGKHISSFWKFAGLHVVNVNVSPITQLNEIDKSVDALKHKLAELKKKYGSPEKEEAHIKVLNTAAIGTLIGNLDAMTGMELAPQERGMAPTRHMYKELKQRLPYNSGLRTMLHRMGDGMLKAGIRYYCVACDTQRPPQKEADANKVFTCSNPDCGKHKFEARAKSKYARVYQEDKTEEYAELRSKGIFLVPTLELPTDEDDLIFEPVGTMSEMHLHMRARRKMLKLFLAHLHMVWSQAIGLPPSTPYAHGILGHSPLTMIDPWSMVDRDEPAKVKTAPKIIKVFKASEEDKVATPEVDAPESEPEESEEE